MDLVVATAIFGGYDRLRTPPVVSDDLRYVCFTDEDQECDPWEVQVVDPGLDDRRLNAFHCKILAHRYLQEECVLWIDGNKRLSMDHRVFASLYLNNLDLATFKHPLRDCTYSEAVACIRFGRFTPSREAIELQMEAYREEGLPKHAGMIEGCVLLRRRVPWVVGFCELWWLEAMKHSYRFQLSFNYLMWKYRLKYKAIPVGIYKQHVRQSRHLKKDQPAHDDTVELPTTETLVQEHARRRLVEPSGRTA